MIVPRVFKVLRCSIGDCDYWTCIDGHNGSRASANRAFTAHLMRKTHALPYQEAKKIALATPVSDHEWRGWDTK